ncbi:MAG: hypothetical protein ACE5GQ_08925 [Nitrospinales bacterium]
MREFDLEDAAGNGPGVWLALFWLGYSIAFVSGAEAGQVTREADCQKDAACMEEYQRQKSAWEECLQQAGLSEKKRARLNAAVERLGIRNLKKQETLILNSKRKQCHQSFRKALSTLKTPSEDRSIIRWPSPIDRLMK